MNDLEQQQWFDLGEISGTASAATYMKSLATKEFENRNDELALKYREIADHFDYNAKAAREQYDSNYPK